MATSPPLNVIALVSGGKDSFFALMHCLAQGHSVVALANLHPPTTEVSSTEDGATAHAEHDLNSHMYQTAGHALIPFYADVLPFPLFRAPIVGEAVERGREYAARAHGASQGTQDETEALLPLLRRILRAHPAANALCTGAILSTYQRTRVESVCARLGLVSLAYLWQFDALARRVDAPPDALLQDMARAGLDARIVKVASGGLDDRFLWRSLADPQVRHRVVTAMRRFGGSVLGEGGEFETLVVSGPPGLWKARIHVPEEDRRVVLGQGGEAFLSFSGAQIVEDGTDPAAPSHDFIPRIRIPGLWDPLFEAVQHDVRGQKRAFPFGVRERQTTSLTTSLTAQWTARKSLSKTSSFLYLSNFTGPVNGTLQQQMQDIREQLLASLRNERLSPSDLVFTTILLRSMADFVPINSIYAEMFTDPIPPARVTVAVGEGLPPGIGIMVSATAAFIPRKQRHGLHVQSRSYWAPANIGPYSQGISIKTDEQSALTFIAGQIPLVPASMQLLDTAKHSAEEAFLQHAALSAQHLWRIGNEMSVRWWPGAIAFLGTQHASEAQASLAEQVWRSLQRSVVEVSQNEDSEDEAPDLWEQRYGGQSALAPTDASQSTVPTIRCLDAQVDKARSSFFLAVEVLETPRGCPIEWQSIGLAAEEIRLGALSHGSCTSINLRQGESMSVAFCEYPESSEAGQVVEYLKGYGLCEDQDASSSPLPSWHVVLYTSRPRCYGQVRGQVVPCHRLLGSNGIALHTALILYGEGPIEALR